MRKCIPLAGVYTQLYIGTYVYTCKHSRTQACTHTHTHTHTHAQHTRLGVSNHYHRFCPHTVQGDTCTPTTYLSVLHYSLSLSDGERHIHFNTSLHIVYRYIPLHSRNLRNPVYGLQLPFLKHLSEFQLSIKDVLQHTTHSIRHLCVICSNHCQLMEC